MRIERIGLSWFRGSGPAIQLDTNAKSVAVYGPNGAGKSTFADALEYVIRGKVRHLAHEYSGSNQVKGARNTHAPPGAPSRISLTFPQRADLSIEIDDDGNSTLASEDQGLYQLVQGWDPGRVLLRQDDVASFIHSSKGEKYSALLPLLGLAELEIAAENLRKLGKAIRDVGGAHELEEQVSRLEQTLDEAFGGSDDASVRSALGPLTGRYLDRANTHELDQQVAALSAELRKRRSFYERDLRLATIKEFKLGEAFHRWSADQERAASLADELLDRHIAVLEPTDAYVRALGDGEAETSCPACGRQISRSQLATHTREELNALAEARSARQSAKSSAGQLERTLRALLNEFSAPEVEDWLEKPERAELRAVLKGVNDKLESGTAPPWIGAEELDLLLRHLEGLPDRPPSANELFEDQEALDAARSVLELAELRERLKRIDSVRRSLTSAEDSLREAIRDLTTETLEDISDEVQRLWGKLHPGEPIEGVHLYASPDRDKAIDVALSFFGVEQHSPRLTLSEGHRNSLGLAIFLAIARQSTDPLLPIVLDDVVSSMDREHRGFVADLLKDELGGRQMIVLTHDREWFGELRRRLDRRFWEFRVLRPFDDPAQGLRWLDGHGDTLDEARSLLDEYPEPAANRARAFMDSRLALIAQRIELPIPYRRGDANDQRTCNDFLPTLVKEAGNRLKEKVGDTWNPVELTALITAQELLLSWGNRASHTGTATRNEANRLIQACESAVRLFQCSACESDVWRNQPTSGERFQCNCGHLRWKR